MKAKKKMNKKQKKRVKVKTEISIVLPATLSIITDPDDEGLPHYIKTQEDLEATLDIASTCGWKVKYNKKIIIQ